MEIKLLHYYILLLLFTETAIAFGRKLPLPPFLPRAMLIAIGKILTAKKQKNKIQNRFVKRLNYDIIDDHINFMIKTKMNT